MKFHKGSKNEGWRRQRQWGGGLDEDLFTPEESAVAFIVSLNTQRRALKRLEHVKASVAAFCFSFFFSLFHPSPLTDVLSSQGATVLLNGPFLFLTPEAQAVAEVDPPSPPPPPPQPPPPSPIPPYYGIELRLTFVEKQWLKAFHFSGLLIAYKKDLFTLCFQCGVPVIFFTSEVTE